MEKQTTKKDYTTLTIFISCIIISLILVVLGGYAIAVTVARDDYARALNNNYRKSYLEVINNIDSIEVDISKLVATTASRAQREILLSLYSTCNLANANISSLPISSNKLIPLNQFVNTLGGYSYSLLTRVSNGDKLVTEDFDNIISMHTHANAIKYDLNYELQNNANNMPIIDINAGEDNSFGGGLTNVESTNSKVPSLIYDGPFSESVINKEVKGLSGDEITQADGVKILKELYKNASVSSAGDTNGKLATYNYNIELSYGTLYAQITKRGGKLISLTSYGVTSTQGNKKSQTECVSVGQEYLSNLGYENMHMVWSMTDDNMCYINYAPIINHIIYYPDIIKVKIDLHTANVIGVEATNYIYNHVDREPFNYTYSINAGKNKVSKALTIKEQNIARIPLEYGGEVYAYEYIATWQDYTYYVYLDVNTLEELNVLRVVGTSSGSLLL